MNWKSILLENYARRGRIIAAILTASLLPLAVTAQEDEEEIEEEEEIRELTPFEVSAERDRGYGSAQSQGATRIALPAIDISTNVVTVNQELIRDTGAVNIQDALKYVSGVTQVSMSENNRISIRGYQANSGSQAMDGLPGSLGGGGVNPLDMALFDRFEVLKGPNGLLYGAHVLGGLVNRITKKPRYVRETEVTAHLRTYSGTGDAVDNYRVTVDTTGPLGKNRKWAYRVIGSWQDGESRHGEEDKFVSIAPQIEFRYTDNSLVRFLWQHVNHDQPRGNTTWVSASGEKPHTFIDNLQIQQLPHSFKNVDSNQFTITNTSKFTIGDSEWATNIVGRYSDSTHNWLLSDGTPRRITLYDASGTALGTTVEVPHDAPIARAAYTNWFTRNFNNRTRAWLANFDLTGEFDVGPTNHKFITGLQVGSQTRYSTQYSNSPEKPPEIPGGFELWPNFVADPAHATTIEEIQVDKFYRGTTTSDDGTVFNWVLQDNMRLYDGRFIVVAGIRYDYGSGGNTNRLTVFSDSSTGFIFIPSEINTDISPFNEWTPKFGIIIKPVEGVAIFYNKTQTYQVVRTLDERLNSPTFGQVFPNREGKVDEVGVKLELWDNRVIATASWFDIRLTNALGSFPDDDGSVTGIEGFSYRAPIGEATNKGYEVDVAFEPIDGLSLLASWSDLEALTEIGRRQRNAPQHTHSLFGSYRFSTGSLNGFSFGGGFHRVEDRAWDSRDTGSLPDYTVGQMFIRYSREAWDVQLNIDNVADIIYYGGSTANTTMAFMDPRTYSLRFRYRF